LLSCRVFYQQMSDLRFRPRFQLYFKSEKEEIIGHIKDALFNDNPAAFHGKVKHNHFTIRINPNKKHYWSPVLDISFEKTEKGQTQMRCLLAPEPTVWTLFMFAYTITIFAAFLGLMIGGSQMQLKTDAWGFYLATAASFLSIVLFFIAQYGKKLATEEMKSMQGFIYKLKDKIA